MLVRQILCYFYRLPGRVSSMLLKGFWILSDQGTELLKLMLELSTTLPLIIIWKSGVFDKCNVSDIWNVISLIVIQTL